LSNPYSHRIENFRKQLLISSIDAALISKKESIFYFTGLHPGHPTEREAYLFLSPSQILLFHSPFITPPSATACLPMSAINPLSKILVNFFNTCPVIGIEKSNLTLAEFERTQSYLPQHTFQAIDTIVAHQRMIKDDGEIRHLKKAGTIAATVLRWCRTWLDQQEAVGITEIAVAQEIESRLKQLGADGPAFPTIVAFDANSAKPHHWPDQTKLRPDSIILIDMGAGVNQYKSDLTRTWQRRTPANPLFAAVKKAVMGAYRQTVEVAQSPPPLTANQLDSAARTVISKAGYGDQFIHSTGHGIGLEAHELPHISAADDTKISSGIAFTIEPGIYLPNQFGYRHENTFINTQSGLINLTA
jgi:Xaa-Pro dipeptidase